MHDRGFQRVVMQDGRIDEARELGLASRDFIGLIANAPPNRVDLVETFRRTGTLVSHHMPRLQSWPGLSRPSRLGESYASLSGMRGSSPRMTGYSTTPQPRRLRQPPQKTENCRGETVVAVAGHHVLGAAHIGKFGMRH